MHRITRAHVRTLATIYATQEPTEEHRKLAHTRLRQLAKGDAEFAADVSTDARRRALLTLVRLANAERSRVLTEQFYAATFRHCEVAA